MCWNEYFPYVKTSNAYILSLIMYFGNLNQS